MLDRAARQNLPGGYRATSLWHEKTGRWSATMPLGDGGLGIGTIVVLGLIGWALGIDPRLLIGGAEIFSGGGTHVQQPMQPPGGQARRTSRPSDDIGRFVSITIGNINAVWTDVFRQYDGR